MASEKLDVILRLISGDYKREAREAAVATGQIGTAAKTSSGGVGILGQNVDGVGKKLKGLAAGALLAAGAGMIKFGADAIKAASNLEESMNAVQVVFTTASKKITDFGETSAEAAGLAQSEFQQMATVLGAALSNAGFAADDMAEKTIELTQRAADMASVFNTEVPDALGAIQAALRGESDPIEKYGVSLAAAAVSAEAAALGFQKVGGEFDTQAKTAARLSLIMKQTDRVAGDFANTSGSLANKTKTLSAQFTDMQARVGKELGPSMVKLLGTAEDLLPTLEGLAIAVADLVGFAGDLVSVAGGASDEMERFGLILESNEEVNARVVQILREEALGLDAVAIAALEAGAQITAANTAAREAPAIFEEVRVAGDKNVTMFGNLFPVVSTAAEKYERLAAGVQSVISAKLALVSPILAAVQAQDRAADAAQNLKDVEADAESTTRDVATAQLELFTAAAEAEVAQEQLRVNGIEPTALALADFADGPLTEAIDLLRELKLISDEDIRIIFDLDAKVSDQLAGVLPFLNGSFGNASGGPSIPGVNSFASGGMVPGWQGQPQLILAHGGEVITPNGAVTNNKTGPTINVYSPSNNLPMDLQYASILSNLETLVS